jgi:hypothetical protein
MSNMTSRNRFVWLAAVALVCGLCAPGFAQGDRGKAEFKAGAGSVVIDYGKVDLKGRDMLGQLAVGSYWRLGSNAATSLRTPVELTFGTSKVAKGLYTLRLKRTGTDAFSLTFDSTAPGEHGSNDASAAKEVASVPLKKEALGSPVETLSITLDGSGNKGAVAISWGVTKLSAEFAVGK